MSTTTTTEATKAAAIVDTIERATTGAVDLRDAWLIAELLGLGYLTCDMADEAPVFALTDSGREALDVARAAAGRAA